MGILNSDFLADDTNVPEMAGVKGRFADAGLDMKKAALALEVDGAGDGIWKTGGRTGGTLSVTESPTSCMMLKALSKSELLWNFT